MNWDLFWQHKTFFGGAEAGVGFSVFSAPHLIWVFLMALAFPTVTAYPPINFYTIHQFVLHGGIAAYIIAKYAAGEIRPRYADLWVSVLVIGVLAVPIYLLDMKVGTNFMFLTNHSGNPVLKLLWELSGGNGGLAYVFALVAFIALVLHVVFLIYVLIGRASKRAN